MRRSITLVILFFICSIIGAQTSNFDDGFNVVDNTFNPNRNAADSLKASHKEVPKGMNVWTVDDVFGDREEVELDTAQHLFMNSIFTTGRYGEYNTTGNLGAPRVSRIATDRDYAPLFPFTEPYGYFITPPSELRFTNTLSPITNVSFNSCGNRTNGEDHLKALFAVNVNKETGIGFKFDYLYGRGYYQNQSTALFDYTMWGSYIGERYQAHLSMSFDHMKTKENGGITDDNYITHPEIYNESYSESEIPVLLTDNWNRTNAFHLNLSHRYNVGFYRTVPMTEQEKEAKRFALKAAKEKLESEKQSERKTEKTSSGATSFSGRPADAKVVGDINSDSIKDVIKRLAEQKKQMEDSLAALRDTVATDTSWTKEEYVPVSSFIHTLQLSNYNHTYIGYKTPADLYLNRYAIIDDRALGDSLYDRTSYFDIKNIFAVGLLEGFNKYVPMGAKVYISHNLRHYNLPDIDTARRLSYNESAINVGGEILKTTGKVLHYKLSGEFGVIGDDFGDILLSGEGDLNFRLSERDSVSTLLKASYSLVAPKFYQATYHSKHFWWDNDDFSKQMQTHLEGEFRLSRTRTALRVAYDNFQNLTYLGVSYNRGDNGTITGYTANMRQTSKNISLLTLALHQDFKLGILNWENRITFQQSSDNDILPVPALNIWSNLYIDFRIARVLSVHFGADVRYFTKYNAPEYVPQLSQYAVQENSEVRTEVGNYPIIDAYCNFKLRHCRFFVMMSHVNAGSGNPNYFLTPHYPLNQRVLRLGLSWTFFN